MEENQTISTKSSTPQKRQVAKLVHLKDINDGSYVKQEGWEPNYVRTTFGEDLFRVNVVGVIVEAPLQIEGLTQFSCTFDDGTGKMELRAFEELVVDGNLDVGTPVLVIGKPREYNNVYYILPEIIRPIEKAWVDFRKKELDILDAWRDEYRTHAERESVPKTTEPGEPSEKQQGTETVVKENTVEFNSADEHFDDVDEGLELDDPEEKSATPMLLELIDTLDDGDGVSVADLDAKVDDAEEKVTRLLLHGEIYEIKPGRVKVLR